MKTLTAATFLAGALALPAPALAQRGAAQGSAQSHYALGSQLYAAGRFAEAAGEFELAYAISGRSELLYNLARAREDAGDDARALDAYARFEQVGAPGVDRAQLAARVAAVRARAAARNAPSSPAPPLAPPPPRPPPAARSLTGPVVVLAAGGALLVGAVPLWLTALGDFDALEQRCPARQCASPSDLALRDDAAARAVIGDVLGGLGVAAAVAGTAWLVVTLTAPAPAAPVTAPRAAVWCGRGGCNASVGFAF